MDWARASAATVVCEERGTTLRDIVQGIMDGADTPDTVMELLGLQSEDQGADKIPEIMDIFVPVVNAWKSGGCGGGCAGCGGGCGYDE
ncbi:MAG: hypothetical protein LBT15_00500 [Synergistaceae bacterium]|jgi:hypothetical protein|nr:hypothetical protein [Synergistaceae bacterium]